MNTPDSKTGRFGVKHGMSRTAEYEVWEAMIQRCTNPNNQHYARYGGRGITVCKRWRDFKNFIADMGKRPPGLTIERKNNNAGYSRRNCMWATRAEQYRNQSRNVNVTAFGKTMCVRDWSKATGLTFETLRGRIARGVTPEKALTTAPPPRRGLIKAFGKSMCLAHWAAEVGMRRETLAQRLNAGWSAEEAMQHPVDSRRGRRGR